MHDRQRTFINCLPSNDLEMWFLGTIFCEMDDFDQTPPEHLLISLSGLKKRMVRTQFGLSEKTSERLK